jgi:hypothetical protein
MRLARNGIRIIGSLGSATGVLVLIKALCHGVVTQAPALC